MTKLICKKTCSTCQGVEKKLHELGIEYELRLIDVDNPSEAELTEWYEKSGLPLTRFINTSGLKYRESGLSARRQEMTDQEVLAELATDGMLVKRPILFYEDKFFIGPDVLKFLETLPASPEE